MSELDEVGIVKAIRQSCTPKEFIEAMTLRLREAPESISHVMSQIYRLRNRGEVSADLVKALESEITRAEGLDCGPISGVTIDLASARSEACASTAHHLAAVLEVGQVLRDRYVIEKRLGSGGKGTVYKALDRYRSRISSSATHVAIKILNESVRTAHDPSHPLNRELDCAQMLAHQNIVRCFDIDHDGERDFLIMELLEGELLSDVLARFHPHPLARTHAWSIIGQIAAGIAHAHDRGVVHADLKPQNIMITKTGEVRILDFGASYALSGRDHSEAERRSTASATPAYACCELLDGRKPDPRDDLYALACIAYELLSAAHPFQRRRATEARDFGVVAQRPPGLTRRQWGVLSKGLSWHRAGRSIPVAKWIKRLKPVRREAPQQAEIRHWKPLAAKPQRAPLFRASAVLVLLVSTIAAWMLFVRLAPGGKVRGEALPTLANGHLGGGASAPPSIPAAAPLPAPKTSQYSGAMPAIHRLSITPSDYSVQAGEHFAEIRVHRPSSAHGNTPFVWWTESATAQPGVDYVGQSKVVQSFPKGKDSTSFFVKLLPRTSRSQPEVFYIAVADQSGRNTEHVTHSTVRLPSVRNTS